MTVLPGLAPLLQPSDTGAPHDCARIGTTIADTGLHLVTSWLDTHLCTAMSSSPRGL